MSRHKKEFVKHCKTCDANMERRKGQWICPDCEWEASGYSNTIIVREDKEEQTNGSNPEV